MSEAASISKKSSYSEVETIKVYKRTLVIVVIAQLFSGLALTAGITVGALIAEQMLNSSAYSGIPIALLTFGSAVAAYVIGKGSNRWGRRLGLTFGFLVGGIGAAGIVVALMLNSITLFFISLFLYGAGTAANLQARYAGTDLAKKHQRATAISIAMVATTFGAVVGPNLVNTMGDVAETISLPMLSGVFILGAIAFFVASIIIFIGLRPDPLFLAKEIASNQQKSEQQLDEGLTQNKKGVIIGGSILIINQVVMASIMTMTPIHMQHFGHHLSDVGLVISIHVAGMYLPSLFSGFLADKIGKISMTILSGVTLALSASISAFASGDSLLFMIIALGLLGLGWNFAMISGTLMIVDATSIKERAKTQGKVDVYLAIAGATGGMFSGIVVAASSYQVLSIIGMFLSLIFVVLMLLDKNKAQK